ncbi:MAG TPA: hypothetical protein PK416_08905 [Thermodesulfobacteriota bacterium]|nr:hypothetical protein [Thermodesulfobacteriota bacterium]
MLKKAEKVVLGWSAGSGLLAWGISRIWDVSFGSAVFEVMVVWGLTIILFKLYEE